MEGWKLLAALAAALFIGSCVQRWNRRLARKHMAGRPPRSATAFGQTFYPEYPAVAAEVRMIMEEILKVDLSRLQPQDQPVRDLHLGALGAEECVDVVVALERRFGITIEDEEAAKAFTVDDVVRLVARKIVR